MNQAPATPREIGVYVIDDDPIDAQNLKNTIEEEVPSADVQVEHDFRRALEALPHERPDVVVLDLLLGGDLDSLGVAGRPAWDWIWRHRFVPIVLHTAFPDLADELGVPADNPYVKLVPKDRESDIVVVESIRSFLPSIKALEHVRDEVEAVMRTTLKAIAETGAFLDDSGSPDPGLLVRGARRRIAATMDLDLMTAKGPVQSWEQYIVPPLGHDLLLGDVLRKRTASHDDAAGHGLVVTPSCDLARRDQGKANVEQVLVARCMSIGDWFQRISLSKGQSKAPRSLREALSEPVACGCLCLPGLPGLLPHMAADFRALQLIPYAQVDLAPADRTNASAGNAAASYTHVRVASIDSPFREYVAWAYHQVSGRVGLPERDRESWATEALDHSGWLTDGSC